MKETENRFEITKRVGLFGIIGNIFLFSIKAIVGFSTKSQAMIADSINSAGDIFASIMTSIGNKIASTPQDSDHNFGHGKAEYIFSLFISISMIFVSIKTLIDACKSLINGSQLTFSWWLVIVCVATIITKLFLYIYVRISYKKCKNILLQASMEDHRNDCIITTFTLISVLLSLKGIQWFDGIVGIGISAWICKTGVEIFIESYNVLMDKSISIETKNKVLDIIKEEKQVKKVIHFNSTPVGYKYQISFTIYVDGNMSTFDSHEIANNLEEKIVDKVEEIYLVVIHVNPM